MAQQAQKPGKRIRIKPGWRVLLVRKTNLIEIVNDGETAATLRIVAPQKYRIGEPVLADTEEPDAE